MIQSFLQPIHDLTFSQENRFTDQARQLVSETVIQALQSVLEAVMRQNIN